MTRLEIIIDEIRQVLERASHELQIQPAALRVEVTKVISDMPWIRLTVKTPRGNIVLFKITIEEERR